MSGFEILAGVAAAAGTALQVSGTLQQGKETQARYQYEQKVDAQQADEAQAASQRDAAQRYKEGQFLLSQQRAAIAGSGGDLSDPSVIDLMGDTADATAYAAESEIYKGEQQRRGYDDAAKVAGINATNAMKAARISAAAGLFDGITSMYSRFGQQAKKTAPASAIKLPYG
ncbi:hypothetical protein QTL95_27035 [Rhizobium sp. S152]|uniref:hypothetical protein n=1 Tax=Rhizobium sp. S152 TaxID=3055038 RepID=UPI00055AC7AA|nr:hypothetical protein [Rhizobium sp. S152]MDM9629544.1 hypothetical protein [Rhizobium sp. S152]